jgi:uncharacterized protein YbjQ (UPF0145 family)
MARPFSSDLTVGEAFVVREAGVTPIAQVMGSSVYRVGWQTMPWGARGWGISLQAGETFELETQTAAWNEARSLALGRLRDEAVAVGADAVVGMRLTRGGDEWGGDLVEFVAIGTAVRLDRFELDVAPVISHLSGQDFAKLVRHGFWPVGIVAGSTIAYVAAGWGQQSRVSGMFSGRQNQELPDYTQGLYDARELAMARVSREAHALHAHGVVGVTIDRREHTRERDVGGTTYTDLVIELHVLGTAIVEVRHDAPAPEKFLALPLQQESS